jgi:sterol desaturase/sphingolipid hydroxylase (fatty acid hydroxylase superfamily)
MQTIGNLAAPLLAMLLACYVELLTLKRWRGITIPWRDTVFNLNSGHVILWVCRGFEVIGYAWVLQHASVHWVNQLPLVAQWLFGFLAWDFCFYWMHRLHHKFPFLWAIHGIHHEGEHFNLSLGIRNSWYSSLSNFPFIVGLAVLGLPVEIFVVVSSIHYTVQFYNHNGWVKRSGFLERLMVTPAYHRVHHGMNAVYVDKNFGGTFQFWDFLFGTHQYELPNEPIRYGVAQPTPSNNPFWVNTLPFLKALGIGHSLQIGRIEDKFPSGWMARAGFVLFLVVVFYVWIEPAWLLDWMDVARYWARWVFVALITAGTIAVGAATDGRRWGMWLWLLIMAALVGFLITVIGSNGFENGRYTGVVFALSLLLLIHALECLYLLLIRNLRKGER